MTSFSNLSARARKSSRCVWPCLWIKDGRSLRATKVISMMRISARYASGTASSPAGAVSPMYATLGMRISDVTSVPDRRMSRICSPVSSRYSGLSFLRLSQTRNPSAGIVCRTPKTFTTSSRDSSISCPGSTPTSSQCIRPRSSRSQARRSIRTPSRASLGR